MIDGISPRVMVVGNRLAQDVNIAFDPRIAFKEDAVGLMQEALWRPGTAMTEPSLHALASIASDAIHKLHARGLVEVEERLDFATGPEWEHDCGQCTFIGHSGGMDMYHCTQVGSDTLIARYGPGGDYISGTAFAEVDETIWKAAVLAEAMGLGRWLDGHHTVYFVR